MKLHFLAKGLTLIAIIAAIAWLLGDLLDRHWIDSHIRGHGVNGQLLFLALGTAFIAAGLSRQFIAILAGYGFGFSYGLLLVELASILGCIIAFYYARWFGSKLFNTHFPEKIRKIDDFIEQAPFTKTLIVRLLPVGSNLLTNLAAGISRMPLLPFLLGSALGYLPQNIVFSLVGSGIQVDPALRIGIGTALFILSGILGMVLLRRQKNAPQLTRDLS